MITKIIPYYTYDDVLIKPRYSEVESRRNVCLKSKLTKNITLNIPLISSNMDTITEENMAIEIAKLGGLGIIHRYCTIEQQENMVKKVKRYTNYLIKNPYSLNHNCSMKDVILFLKKMKIKSILIEDENKKIVGIFTNRDLTYFHSLKTKGEEKKVCEYMTKKDKLITIVKMNLMLWILKK